MKKLLKKLLSLTLAVIMIASMATVGITSVSAEGTLTNMISVIGGRAFSEFTSYCISNQVPYLGGAFYYLLCDPGTRSSIQNSAKISAILSSVTEIQNTLDDMMKELDKIEAAVNQGNAEIKYMLIKQNLDKYAIDEPGTHGYQTVWYCYEDMLEYLSLADEARANGNDELGDSYDAKAKEAHQKFLNEYRLAFLGGQELPYSEVYYNTDMDNINNLICGEDPDPLSQFLPALEKMLRLYYPCEHQITEQMYSAYEYCEVIQTRMYLIHKEYATYTYMNSTDDEIPQDFFAKETEKLEENLNNQIINSGLNTLMTTEDVSDVEGFKIPYEFHTSVKINGKEYPCYIVRDNADLEYYLILEDAVKASDLVTKWRNPMGIDVYRPTGIIDSEYTDNGEFQMISSVENIEFLQGNPIGNLNYVINKTDEDGYAYNAFSKDVKSIALFSGEYYDDWDLLDRCDVAGWKVNFLDINEKENGEIVTATNSYTTEDLKDGSAKDKKCIVIYKCIANDLTFDKNNTLTVAYEEKMPSTIVLKDGETLNYSKLNNDVSGCKIIISGEATVIGNPEVTLKDSQILVCTDEQVTLDNVNVKAPTLESAIVVNAYNAKINFKNNNTFTGNGKYIDEYGYPENDYNNNPVGAAHGMLINDNASVTLTGATATFNGSSGGAGICTWGDLVIDNATIIANGSYCEKTYIMDYVVNQYLSDTMKVYDVGAGIGASFTYTYSRPMIKSTYNNYGTITIKNNSDVTANGCTPKGTSNCYSMDIGGVTYISNAKHYNNGIHTESTSKYLTGSIENSKVTTGNGRIDKDIKKSNGTFNKDSFTITTSTAGSDGVTSDNISFKLYGTVGGKEVSTNWVTQKCGDDKGEYTFVFTDTFIGSEITRIDVKIDGSNGWYPEYVKVTSDCSQINQTFYGGRWLDNSETITLTPEDNVFRVDIKTENDDNAGTDADVYVQLVDEKGNTSDTINASDVHPESDAFEKGDNMSLYMYAPENFEKLEYININTDANGTAAADWKIESLGAEQVSGKHTGDKFNITVNQWDPNGVTMSFGRETGKSGTFEFDIKTQNKSGAGTDATIKIKLIGENGETNLVNVEPFIDSYTPGDNFEKNNHDKGRITFKMPEGGIGEIEKIYVESSGGAASADWDLEYIDVTEIVPDGTGQHVRFDAKCTIKKNSNRTFDAPIPKTSVMMTSSIDRELLKKYQVIDENSYLLSVNEPVVISADALKHLKENNITLTVEMKDGEDILYQVTFDGSQIKTFSDVTINKSYDIKDKETFIEFIENSHIPEGTTLTLYLDKLGFTEYDKVILFVKDENGRVSEHSNQPVEGEVYHEFEISKGYEYILKSKDESTSVDKDVVDTSDPTSFVIISLMSLLLVGTVLTLSLKKKKEQ